MFPAMPIKPPSEGLSFEQEAAPSRRGLDLSQERSLASAFQLLFLCLVTNKVSFVSLGFARTPLCLSRETNIGSPILQMGK